MIETKINDNLYGHGEISCGNNGATAIEKK
jgi:hypothetical protein